MNLAALIGMAWLLAAIHADDKEECARIAHDYRIVSASLQNLSDGFSIQDTPAASALLSREWSLIAEWAASHATEHKRVTASEIQSDIKQLDTGLDVSVASLGRESYGIAVNKGEIGTVFLIARVGQRFALVWSIERDATREVTDDEGVGAWSAYSARKWGMYGHVHILPPSASGNARFYIDGTHAQMMGATVMGQLSIWEWNGRAVNLLFMRNYPYFIDGSPTILDHDVLRVHVKEHLKTFFSCGGCPEPDAEWSVRVGLDDIEDLGVKWTVPEMRTVDELFYRVQRRKSAADLAAADVITMLDAVIEDINGNAKVEHDYEPLGMLMDWKVERHADISRFCLSVDGLSRYLFTITRLDRGLYVNAVQNIDNIDYGEDCAEVLAARTEQ